MATVPDSPLTIEPEASRWRSMLAPFPNLTAEQRRFREELGLPTDRPVILSGHQAAVWHPGILAKHLAASAAARAMGAAAAWLVVDQDANDFVTLRVPMRDEDERLGILWLTLSDGGDGSRTDRGIPPAMAPVLTMPDPGPLLERGRFAATTASGGLSRIAAALSIHRGEASAARQLGRAVTDLIQTISGPLPLLFATDLGGTELFRRIVSRLTTEPRRAIDCYNAAVRAHPGARLRPLAVSNDAVELPLWHLQPGQARLPATTRSIDSTPGLLAPRALLMTGLLRLAGCDLFIHGTGGGGSGVQAGYDRVTGLWLGEWMGATLAPSATVTATLRLPIESTAKSSSRPDLAEIDAARALAHRARHNPALLGDAPYAQRKAELVAEIREAKEAGHDSGAIYRRMHALLETYRELHGPDLADLRAKAQEMAASHSEAAIFADRTWPFPLYPDAMLQDLKSRIDSAFSR